MIIVKPTRRLSLQTATLMQATILLAAAQQIQRQQKQTPVSGNDRQNLSRRDTKIEPYTYNDTSPTTTTHDHNDSDKCLPSASCKTRPDTADYVDKLTDLICRCDEECGLYDDCCHDANSTISTPHGLPHDDSGGHSDHSATNFSAISDDKSPLETFHSKWHCNSLDEGPEGVLIMTSCPPGWADDTILSRTLAQKIERLCLFGYELRSKSRNDSLWREFKSDPLGTITPVTDLLTGITYANSFCLRCNREVIRKNQQLNSINALQFVKPKLVGWKPIVKCNFNNKIYNSKTLSKLIRENKANALEYSQLLNKWIISTDLLMRAATSTAGENVGNESSSSSMGSRNKLTGMSRLSSPTTTTLAPESLNNNSNNNQQQPICTFEATPPESSRSVLRVCRADTIRECLRPGNSAAHKECRTGYQGLVFSRRIAGIAYHNLGCALCNDETLDSIQCEPPIVQQTSGKLISSQQQQQQQQSAASNSSSDIVTYEIMTATMKETSKPKNKSSSSSEAATSVGYVINSKSPTTTTTLTSTTIKTSSSSSSSASSSTTTTTIAFKDANQTPAQPIKQHQKTLRPFAEAFPFLFDFFGGSTQDSSSSTSSLPSSLVGQVHQCPGLHQVYDPIFGNCRCLVCGLNKFYRNGRCVDRTSNMVSEIID